MGRGWGWQWGMLLWDKGSRAHGEKYEVTLRPLDPFPLVHGGELSKVTFDIEKEVHHVCFVTNKSENNTGNFFSGTTDELLLSPAVCLGVKGY